MSSDVVRARIDPGVKARAVDALDAMGLSVSDAIRLLMVRIADERRLPFDMAVPDARTAAAIRELSEGGGERFADAEALWKDLGL